MIRRLQLIQLLSTVCSVPSPRRGFGGLSPPKQSYEPPNWNVEHYSISVELLSIFRISSPSHKRKAPLLKTF